MKFWKRWCDRKWICFTIFIICVAPLTSIYFLVDHFFGTPWWTWPLKSLITLPFLLLGGFALFRFFDLAFGLRLFKNEKREERGR